MPFDGELAALISRKQQTNQSFVHENLAGGLFLAPITALEISATQIRKQFAMKANPRYLLPDSVLDYIKQHDIYSKEVD